MVLEKVKARAKAKAKEAAEDKSAHAPEDKGNASFTTLLQPFPCSEVMGGGIHAAGNISQSVG